MTLKIVDSWCEGEYTEYETFKCSNCGRTQTHLSGADPACCQCEFENEGCEYDEDSYDKETQGFDVPDMFD